MASSMLRVQCRLSFHLHPRRFGLAIAFLFSFLIGLVCATAAGGERSPAPAIVLSPSPSPQACFEVRGLGPDVTAALRKLDPPDARWPQVFAVRVGTTAGDGPSMLGTCEATAAGVRFRPRFPLERGTEYRVVFEWPIRDRSGNHDATRPSLRLAQTFTIPLAPAGPPARVVAIYPSGRVLPENLLRCYIQFSAPMSQGNSYARLHLRDETTGTDVVEPFLELPQELWSADGTRLTLLLEPGRVKRDLVPREQLGPILVAGRNYTLTIDADWPDADGRPLVAAARKPFRAGQPESNQLDPRSWKIEPPTAGTRGSLSVRFPHPLDHAMLEHVLRVERLKSGEPASAATSELTGTVRVADEERRWTLEPAEAWAAGRYVLAVSPQLEDPAGNNLGRPFEVDLKQPSNAAPAPPVVRIEFEIRGRT
jgi:hypothetical protein